MDVGKLQSQHIYVLFEMHAVTNTALYIKKYVGMLLKRKLWINENGALLEGCEFLQQKRVIFVAAKS